MSGDLEFKALPALVRPVEASSNPNGEFSAVISTDALDRDGESIKGGAFDPLPSDLPIFYQHDWRSDGLPLAMAKPYYEGDVLKARGVFASTTKGQEMRALVTEGMVGAMSVGFVNAKRTKVAGKTVVIKGDLIEASFTSIPVNPTARVLSAKAGARNSAADQAMLQEAHDLMGKLGAACAAGKSLDDDDELYVQSMMIEIRALTELAGVDLEPRAATRDAIRRTLGVDVTRELARLRDVR